MGLKWKYWTFCFVGHLVYTLWVPLWIPGPLYLRNTGLRLPFFGQWIEQTSIDWLIDCVMQNCQDTKNRSKQNQTRVKPHRRLFQASETKLANLEALKIDSHSSLSSSVHQNFSVNFSSFSIEKRFLCFFANVKSSFFHWVNLKKLQVKRVACSAKFFIVVAVCLYFIFSDSF